ncbi:hypothetical protein [Nocardioides sp. Leaf285]|uniref:hypothetical protein n=1 Tax=Nocardioides sp. Leaf285 TaxID=1736322 RepID=UPI00070371A9|nr:hypothetical protein [Nocardioides sp. Leaf285]KQP63035.1 hypothetical protein ASF47_18665 [Nocardioides sp. Leaf285]
MSALHTVVSTETTHTVVVTAPQDEPFVIEKDDTTVSTSRVEFKVIVDGTNTLRRVGVQWIARGLAIKADGTVGKQSRLLSGTNPIRLPLVVRLAAQEALRETVGTLHDPDDQMNGWTGRLPGQQA